MPPYPYCGFFSGAMLLIGFRRAQHICSHNRACGNNVAKWIILHKKCPMFEVAQNLFRKCSDLQPLCVLDSCIMEIWEIYNPFSLCGQGILVQSFIQGLYILMSSDMVFLGLLRYFSFYDSPSLCFLMEQQLKDTVDVFQV